MTNNTLLVSAYGVKHASTIGELDALMDWHLDQSLGMNSADKMFGDVSWLYRGVMLRAHAVASMPFDILRGEEVIDSSDDYQNVLGFLPDPETLLLLMEMSLTLTGTTYLAPLQNRLAKATGNLSGLAYYAPQTIRPEYDYSTGTHIGYTRTANGRITNIGLDGLYKFWYPDYAIEVGPPKHTPARAAMSAAGVLYNLDAFVEAFFKSGAIKASVIALAGNPPVAERTRFGEMWQKVMQGARNMYGKLVVSADSVTVTAVGDGVKDLHNGELSTTQREAIAAALMIPNTMLFSGSAAGLGGGGVTSADDARFVQEFQIPETKWLWREFTRQILAPLGYRARPKPEVLDAMQEDEVARMASMSSLVDILLKATSWEMFLAASKVNGMEWDDETDKLLQTVFAQREERRLEVQSQMQQQAQQPDQQAQPDQSNFPVSKPEPKQLAAEAKGIKKEQWVTINGNHVLIESDISDIETRSRGAFEKMPKEQQKALQKYKGEDYEYINAYLRDTGTLSEDEDYDYEGVTKQIDDAIDASEIQKDITVWRGMSDDWLDDEDMTGTEFSDDGYVSTTAIRKQADAFDRGIVAQIDLSKGDKGFALDVVGGDSEGEIILKRGQKYRIIADNYPDEPRRIKLKVVH